MKKNIYFAILLCAIISSCKGQYNNDDRFNIYICDHPIKASDDRGLINIEITNDSIYYNENIFICNRNVLKKRSLTIDERNLISTIISRLQSGEIKSDYSTNPYDANFYFDIYLKIGKNEVRTRVFQDVIPKELSSLLLFSRKVYKDGVFRDVSGEFMNLNVKLLIDVKGDTLFLSSKDAYYFWKELNTKEITFKASKVSNNDIFDYILPVTYPLNCNVNNQIDRVLVRNKSIYVINRNNENYKLIGNYLISFLYKYKE